MSLEHDSAGSRQFERHSTQFEARIEPHPDHAEQFRLSFPAAANSLPVVDVSAGGLALRTGFFVPKNMRFTLSITQNDAHVIKEALNVKVIARRCITLDHKPTYQIGMQFLDPAGNDEQKLIKAVVAAQKSDKTDKTIPLKMEPAGVA